MPDLPRVRLYTDGACPVKGPRAQCGGWANIIIWDEKETIRVGREYPSTNSRMELMALVDGLQALTVPCDVTFYSDSEYVVLGTNVWLDLWLKRRWRVNGNKPVVHKDLWEQVVLSKHIHNIKGIWIRGHLGPYTTERTIHHSWNERCDQMAVAQSLRMMKERADGD